jgi:transposase
MSGKRDLKELERRRLRAAELLRGGMAQAEVARVCEVSRNAVSLWVKALAQGGKPALRSKALGRPARLSPAQCSQLIRALKRGALAAGHATELWSLGRLGKLGWSCQRPGARAIERDERAIRRWKQQRWPALKKTPPKSAA